MTERTWKKLILITDLLSITLSYVLALQIRSIRLNGAYNNALVILLLVYVLLFIYFENRSIGVFRRGFLAEYSIVFKAQISLFLLWVTYLFVTKQGSMYSRMVFLSFFVLSSCTVYVVRCYMKLAAYLILHKTEKRRQCLIITNAHLAESILDNMKNEWDISVTGFILVDRKEGQDEICGIPVLGDQNEILKVVLGQAVDEIFVHIPGADIHNLQELIYNFEQMGIVTHINIEISDINVHNKVIEELASYNVVSFSTNIYHPASIFLKRFMDIAGSIIGLCITGIVFLFVAPAIKLESKGPVFFTQNRVGKNGRVFKIYKFRSMYVDAEERKQALMNQNEMKGSMFKMKNDPRITKVGKFIRKTSIDELPQFWNIFVGDMSMVGTRPPTLEEVKHYKLWHRRRLSIKPGLTGLWQVSGRNRINDFDDVVKYDLEYIDHWSVALDIKLLFKTVLVVFKGTGT